jgi:hypothetical protein
MITTIAITVSIIAIGAIAAYFLLKKDNPKLRTYQKHYSCSVCGNEFNQTLDYCPECAKDKQITVLLHEFFVEVRPGKNKLRLT